MLGRLSHRLLFAMSERHISQALHGNGRSVKPFFVCWCLYTLTLLSSAAVLRGVSAGFDFRNFYAAGYMVRMEPAKLYNLAEQQRVQDMLVSRGDLAMPFIHPSYEALLFAPFSLLSYPRAHLCFIAFNSVLLALLFVAAYPLFSSSIPIWQPRPGLMFFAFLPLYIAILHGQDSVLFFLLCCMVWLQLESGSNVWAGCTLALGLFKFQWAIPIAILWSFRRGWRFFTAFLATAAAVAAICIGIVGRPGMKSLIELVSAASLAHDQSAAAQMVLAISPRKMPNIAGLFYLITHRLPSEFAFAVVLAASTAVFAWCLYLVKRAKDDRVAFAISLYCAALVSHHMYLYDETILLLAVGILSKHISRAGLLAFYILPAILIASNGRDWLFLAALPTLWLLGMASRLIKTRSLTPCPATV